MRRWSMLTGVLALLVATASACAGGGGAGGGGSRGRQAGAEDPPAVDCTAPSPSTGPGSAFSAPPTTDPAFWQLQGRLDETAGRVESLAKGFPDVYAGLALETEHARLAVYRLPSSAFDAALRRELPDAPVRLVDAAHSARQLGALRDRISGDHDYWQGRGVAVNILFAAHDGSCVQVGTHDVDQARQLFPQRYGSDAPIRVAYAEPAVAK